MDMKKMQELMAQMKDLMAQMDECMGSESEDGEMEKEGPEVEITMASGPSEKEMQKKAFLKEMMKKGM